MKKSKFTEERIAFALRQAETGQERVVEICRKKGMAETIFYNCNWKKSFCGLGVPEFRWLK